MKKEEDPTQLSNVVRIGKYTLKYRYDHPKKKPIHKEAMKELRNEEADTLDLSWGKYTRYKWNRVLKYMKESEVQRILAYGNSDKKMLLMISKVNFYNLSVLDLRDCQIQNIESIPSGPNLNYLSLSNNNIYSVASLIKCELSGLKTLILNDNPIINLGLERCNFQLQTFWLERKYNFKVIRQCLSQTSIFKLKSEEMKDISIQSVSRIYQPSCIKRVNFKYPQLERLYYMQPDDVFDEENQFVAYLSEDQELLDNGNQIYQDEIENFPPLHNVEGQNEENWLSEQPEAIIIQGPNSWESQKEGSVDSNKSEQLGCLWE